VRPTRPDASTTSATSTPGTCACSTFIDWLQDWVNAFSDAAVSEPRYIDGPLGNLPATGHRLDLGFCELLHYDASGRIASGEMCYDSMTMLVQLGHMNPPATG